MTGPTFYPPSPPDVPDDLTEPSSKYKTQIGLVLLSLGLFFVLYFGIMAFCTLFFLWAAASVFIAGFQRGPGQGFAVLAVIQLVLCLPLFLLFVYMFKHLFRWGHKE